MVTETLPQESYKYLYASILKCNKIEQKEKLFKEFDSNLTAVCCCKSELHENPEVSKTGG